MHIVISIHYTANKDTRVYIVKSNIQEAHQCIWACGSYCVLSSKHLIHIYEAYQKHSERSLLVLRKNNTSFE